jgi:IS5 family transposase
MFKVLILAAQNTFSDERMEFIVRNRLSWLRFLDFGLGDRRPDENTIRLFREWLTRSGTIEKLFEEFDRQLEASGYLATGGQIVDASLVAAPRQRNTLAEKAQIKAGRKARKIWQDTDARWTVKSADRSILMRSAPCPSCRSQSSATRRTS